MGSITSSIRSGYKYIKKQITPSKKNTNYDNNNEIPDNSDEFETMEYNAHYKKLHGVAPPMQLKPTVSTTEKEQNTLIIHRNNPTVQTMQFDDLDESLSFAKERKEASTPNHKVKLDTTKLSANDEFDKLLEELLEELSPRTNQLPHQAPITNIRNASTDNNLELEKEKHPKKEEKKSSDTGINAEQPIDDKTTDETLLDKLLAELLSNIAYEENSGLKESSKDKDNSNSQIEEIIKTLTLEEREEFDSRTKHFSKTFIKDGVGLKIEQLIDSLKVEAMNESNTIQENLNYNEVLDALSLSYVLDQIAEV